MTTLTVTMGGTTTAPAFITNGVGGAGFVSLVNQSSNPSNPASGLRIFVDNSSRLSWKSSAGIITTLTSAASANRTYTIPDLTDTIVTTTSTATLQNKTINGGATGNTVNADQLRGTSVSASAPNNGDVLLYSGSWTPTTNIVKSGWWIFGDGSDGDLTLNTAATTTLTRDMYYNNLTINHASAILKPSGYRIFVAGTLALTLGTIHHNGISLGTDAQTGAAVTVGATLGRGSAGGNGGNISTAGSNSSSVPVGSQIGARGGSGGAASGAGGTSTAVSPPSTDNGGPEIINDFWRATYPYHLGNTALSGGSGGGGGSGSVNTAGGGGGAGGGVVMITCRILSGSGTISANGGRGSNKTSGFGAGASGGGGGGGAVLVTYVTSTFAGTMTATGGGGGTGGAASGNPGSDGLVYAHAIQ